MAKANMFTCPHCSKVIMVTLRDTISADEARREANRLMASNEYTNRDHPEHGETVEKVQQLFEMAYSDVY